ncbi:helix-turn-helix domain-containing protein [Burkholderia sp. GS2Y]|uniref:Helix-turn-helix domain-containing protein n=1 Tax=Burkholderia theae TaxID=3143496 RepID=A0ABU9WB08_9BURK
MIAHRIALAPNDIQATNFDRAAGTARFAYNLALAGGSGSTMHGRPTTPWPSPRRPHCVAS